MLVQILVIAVLISFWLLSRKESYVMGADPARDAWFQKLDKLREPLEAEYIDKLSAADKKLWKKLVTDANAKLGKVSVPPYTAGSSKYPLVRAGILTEAEVARKFEFFKKQFTYVKGKMQTKMKCSPKLWQPDSFDPSKYKYTQRVLDKDGDWKCPNPGPLPRNAAGDSERNFNTFCSWDAKDPADQLRQCAVYSSTPGGIDRPVPL